MTAYNLAAQNPEAVQQGAEVCMNLLGLQMRYPDLRSISNAFFRACQALQKAKEGTEKAGGVKIVAGAAAVGGLVTAAAVGGVVLPAAAAAGYSSRYSRFSCCLPW
jgi:hypothetical protein